MPKVQCARVGAVYEGGPELWRVELPWDLGVVLEAHGQSLSVALGKLAARVRLHEQDEARREGDGVAK